MVEQEEVERAERPVTVLLVEDEFLIRTMVADEIRQLGWFVVEVGTAEEGLEVVRSPIAIDLLVTDVHMPGSMTGLDLARAVREQRPDTPVVVMSGQPKPAKEHAPLFDVFLPKPVGGLAAAVQALVARTGRRVQ